MNKEGYQPVMVSILNGFGKMWIWSKYRFSASCLKMSKTDLWRSSIKHIKGGLLEELFFVERVATSIAQNFDGEQYAYFTRVGVTGP